MTAASTALKTHWTLRPLLPPLPLKQSTERPSEPTPSSSSSSPSVPTLPTLRLFVTFTSPLPSVCVLFLFKYTSFLTIISLKAMNPQFQLPPDHLPHPSERSQTPRVRLQPYSARL